MKETPKVISEYFSAKAKAKWKKVSAEDRKKHSLKMLEGKRKKAQQSS